MAKTRRFLVLLTCLLCFTCLSLGLVACSSSSESSSSSSSSANTEDIAFANSLTESVTYDGMSYKISPSWIEDSYNSTIYNPDKTSVYTMRYFPNSEKSWCITIQTWYGGETETYETYESEVETGMTTFADEYEIISQDEVDGVIYTLYDRQTEGTNRTPITQYFAYAPDTGAGFYIEFRRNEAMTLEMVESFISNITFNPSITSRSESTPTESVYSQRLQEEGYGSNASSTTTSPSDTSNSPTVSEQNALASAKKYLNLNSGFSYTGLIEQLEYEKFSHNDAVYAADNCGANWNEQAALSAAKYMKVSSFSRGSLIEQLEYEGFTAEQAAYGADSVGLTN